MATLVWALVLPSMVVYGAGASSTVTETERAYQSKDYARARALYDQACKGGEAKGCFSLGTMFHQGKGGPRNKARARVLYDQACKGGDAAGCTNLGAMFSQGEGGPQDKARARIFYDQACRGKRRGLL
jgi:TPR repeat protein